MQIFEDKCREFQDQLHDFAQGQPDALIRNNAQMLKDCQLFSNGGNYAEAEVEWYRGQMNEIDKLIEDCKEKRVDHVEVMNEEIGKLQMDPTHNFSLAYTDSIQQLSAKEGLGKTYGQPRRLAQERLRSEMTKCESAQ